MSASATRKHLESSAEGRTIAWLEITTSDAPIRTPLYEGVYLIGRSKKCQIRPKSSSVSRRHCAIVCHKDRIFVRDIGSKHGTFINRGQVSEGVWQPVADNDELIFGGCRFHFRFAEPQDKPPAAPKSEHIAPAKDSKLGDLPNTEPEMEATLRLMPTDAGIAPGKSPGSSDHDVDVEDIGDFDHQAPSSVPDAPPQEFVESADEAGVDNVGKPLAIEGEEDILKLLFDENEANPQPRTLVLENAGPADVDSATAATAAEKKTPPGQFKYKDKKKAKQQKQEEQALEAKKRKILGLSEDERSGFEKWLESDGVKPVLITIIIIAVLGVVGYNLYSLFFFEAPQSIPVDQL